MTTSPVPVDLVYEPSLSHKRTCCTGWVHLAEGTRNASCYPSPLGGVSLCLGSKGPLDAGVIVCEGLQSDVQEYLSRLRGLKWQVTPPPPLLSLTITIAHPRYVFCW